MAVLWYYLDPAMGLWSCSHTLSFGHTQACVCDRPGCVYKRERPAKRTKFAMVAFLPPCSAPLNELTHHPEGKEKSHRMTKERWDRKAAPRGKPQGPTSTDRTPLPRDETKNL